MPTIPIPRFNDFEARDVGSEEFLDRLTKLSRSLEYIMSHMDHDNVKRLHTNECTIQSEYGETYINGPQLKMYGTKASVIGSTSTGVLRLQIGYDSGTSDFIFKMWNAAGSTMMELDSNGNAVFMGKLRSGAESGQRIEIWDNNFFMYNSSNQLEGLVFGSTFGTWGDIYIYNDGIKKAEFYQESNVVSFRPASTDYAVQIGKADCKTYIVGNAAFTGTGNKIGFFNTTPVAKTAVSTATSTTVDLLNSKLNELISALNSYGIV